MDINADIRSARWTLAKIMNEINTLNKSPAFQMLVNELPATISKNPIGMLRGYSNVPLRRIVVTDNLAHFPGGRWISIEQTLFVPSEQTLYVGINPITGGQQFDDPYRQVRVGEVIAHGIAHYLPAALAAEELDPSGYSRRSEEIAVERANRVAADFNLEPLLRDRIVPFPYALIELGPFPNGRPYCTPRNVFGAVNNGLKGPMFLSDR